MNDDPASWLAYLLDALRAPLFSLGSLPISVLWLSKCLVLLFAAVAFGRWTKQILKKRLLVRVALREGDREVISSLAGFATVGIGIVLVLQGMGLKLENLALIVGGLGVGIGFGLQDITKNLASGITLLGERKLRVGDLVQFRGTEGTIQEISIRSTLIKTFRGSRLVVPNAELANGPVENWSYPSWRGRLEIPLRVDPQSDLVLVTELLLRAASLEPEVLAEPAPKVVFKDFGEPGFNFELWFWVDRIDRGASIKSSVNFLIEYEFRRHGLRGLFRPGEPSLPGIVPSEPPRVSPPVSAPTPIPENLPPHPPLRQLLPGLRYFQDFDEIELRRLIELGRRVRLADGEILVEQGKVHRGFCIVLEGAIDAIYENDKISRRMFTFQPGEFFGELPLLLKIPYPTTMRAAGETSLFVIGTEGFHELLARYPRLKDDVTEELSRRQENIQLCQATLRSMGLLTEEQDANPVHWLRTRLRKLLGEGP